MISALPAYGRTAAQVLAEIRALRAADQPTHGGRLSAYVYDPGVDGLDALAAEAYAIASQVNGLDPTAFPSLLVMENALVGAAAMVLGGGPDTAAPHVVGSVTSGGTESLILAVKTARDAHPEIARPRLVIPETAHAAFAKAGAYLGVAVDVVPVDRAALRPDPADIASAITRDTVLVACSAPSYAHGVVDPVGPIAAAAAAAGVRCHVDACFGGWTLPYLRRLGSPVPPFGFDVPGVTSVSVDLHKYAYAAKGVSVLLHRDADLRRPQYFAYGDWPGYAMINPVIASTRSGGPIAAAFATVQFLGDDGYLRLAATTREAVEGLADAVRSVDGLRLLAEPESTVVCFTGDNVFTLADELARRGWHTQPQMAYGGLPANIHLTVTASVAMQVKNFRPALAESMAAAEAAGPVVLPPGLVEAVGAMTPESLGADTVAGLAVALGIGGSDGGAPLPPRMAPVNTVVNAAPPAVRERLLVELLGMLQRPVYGPVR